jgi:hypothetical protein
MSKVSTAEAGYQQSKPRQYRLTFKQNRSFELTVKGTTIVFGPNGAQIVDEWVVANMTDLEKQFFNVEAI